eukprot:3012925-Rhodomonas_salina.1
MYDKWVDSNWIDLEHRYLIDDVILDPNRGPPIQPLRTATCASPNIILTQLDEYDPVVVSQSPSRGDENVKTDINDDQECTELGSEGIGVDRGLPVYTQLTPASQDVVPLARAITSFFNASTEEWQGTPLEVDTSQPAGLEPEGYVYPCSQGSQGTPACTPLCSNPAASQWVERD